MSRVDKKTFGTVMWQITQRKGKEGRAFAKAHPKSNSRQQRKPIQHADKAAYLMAYHKLTSLGYA